MELTPQEIQLFRHNGFIKFPTQLSKDHVEALKAAALKDIEEAVEPVARQGDRIIRISAVWQRGGIFQETITCDDILNPLESLLGPNIEFVLNRHNHIYLRDAGSTHSLELHRDVRHWSRTIATVLIYLEETNFENGCTRIVPGSHHLPAFAHLEDETIQQIAASQAIPLPMPAGGLLAIDSMIIHSAGINRTDRTRMSMTLGYHSADELASGDNPKKVLVRGTRPYRGNDEPRK
ncbi:MAG: phytanoyl-CoA dioxygenase family protein [Candidatus Poribacteria bacterium]|nr:phytanoyl-CoA dioxygenase family protein [Candidatus Poribacteria bacterium]